jgi:hypothetical protein
MEMSNEEIVKRLRDLGDHAAFEPHMHHTAADRIEELEAKLKTAEEIGRAFEKDAGQLREKLNWVLVERDKTFALMLDRVQTAEAKLAKAVEVAKKSIKWLRLYGADVHREAATLAELKNTLED